ncbi:hypothetical protein RYX56_23125 [Alkalihalophilus lindianensis]|uniref:T3SS EscN ATPase C-terminal domain-containing protein n=1 Tax=Alkalihalophilus lindianensis TaxID=1630542 RepID=A0ABU3XHW9_9BACI|nr:hypothetical protein [Alkalihalophilus lindianensis]MDV2687242.1 hypothetical protein [Alkalihalophilus lindianensis]
MGAYKKGANRDIDHAMRLKPLMDQFLRQGIFEASQFEEARSYLISQFGAMK